MLPAFERLLKRRAPRATLRLRSIPLDVGGWLRESGGVLVGASDLAASRRKGEALQSERYYEDAFTCLLRKRHPLRSSAWTPARFASARHVLVTPRGATDRGAVDDALAARGLTRGIARVVPSFALAVALVREDDYLTTVPDAYARIIDKRGLTLRRPPIPVPPVAMHLVWHAGRAHDRRLRFLRALLHEALPRTLARRRAS